MQDFSESVVQEVFPGSDLTADEVEFLLAMEKYKRERRRPFPAWHEVLRVVKSLGYRKPEIRDQKSEIRDEKSNDEKLADF